MGSEKNYIISLQIAKKSVDTSNGSEPNNRMLFITAIGMIEGTLLKGLPLPEDGTAEEKIIKMYEENPGGITIFDIAKAGMEVIDSEIPDVIDFYQL